jgi:hypothetical protein
MAAPDWYDPLLRVPTPRPLDAHAIVAVLWTIVGCLAVGGVIGLLTPTITGRVLGAVGLGTALIVAAVSVPILRRESWMLRHGVAAIARVVPAEPTAGATARDVGLAAASIANPGGIGRIGPRLGYEFPAGNGRVVRSTRILSMLAPTPGMFPEGVEVGARFAVLFDPRDPERHAPYRPASMYRIRPPG